MGSGLLSLNTAVLTAYLCQVTTGFRTKRYLSPLVREAISDFGPPLVILGATPAVCDAAKRRGGSAEGGSAEGGGAVLVSEGRGRGASEARLRSAKSSIAPVRAPACPPAHAPAHSRG